MDTFLMLLRSWSIEESELAGLLLLSSTLGMSQVLIYFFF